MKKYEYLNAYRTTTLGGYDELSYLNEQASKGWELVCVVREDVINFVYYWKREISE